MKTSWSIVLRYSSLSLWLGSSALPNNLFFFVVLSVNSRWIGTVRPCLRELICTALTARMLLKSLYPWDQNLHMPKETTWYPSNLDCPMDTAVSDVLTNACVRARGDRGMWRNAWGEWGQWSTRAHTGQHWFLRGKKPVSWPSTCRAISRRDLAGHFGGNVVCSKHYEENKHFFAEIVQKRLESMLVSTVSAGGLAPPDATYI